MYYDFDDAVEYGFNGGARVYGSHVAAKTGTSIKPKENGAGYTNKLYTSIVGYLPSSDPQVLIYVIVDSAQGSEIWGNTVAAPIFKEISTQLTHILNLQPDKIIKK